MGGSCFTPKWSLPIPETESFGLDAVRKLTPLHTFYSYMSSRVLHTCLVAFRSPVPYIDRPIDLMRVCFYSNSFSQAPSLSSTRNAPSIRDTASQLRTTSHTIIQLSHTFEIVSADLHRVSGCLFHRHYRHQLCVSLVSRTLRVRHY